MLALRALLAGLGLSLAGDARAQDDGVDTPEAIRAWDGAAHGRPPLVAAADAAKDANHYEIGAQTVYTMPPIRGGTNPFGVGFGARVGFVTSHVYVGASFVDYLGGTDVDTSETALLLGAESGYDFGVRVGGGRFSLRPQVGVGMLRITRTDPSLLTVTSVSAPRSAQLGKPDVISQATSSSPSPSSSSSGGSSSTTSGSSAPSPSDQIMVYDVYVQPGITALYSSNAYFIGCNGNLLIVPFLNYGGYQASWLALGVQGQMGFRW